MNGWQLMVQKWTNDCWFSSQRTNGLSSVVVFPFAVSTGSLGASFLCNGSVSCSSESLLLNEVQDGGRSSKAAESTGLCRYKSRSQNMIWCHCVLWGPRLIALLHHHITSPKGNTKATKTNYIPISQNVSNTNFHFYADDTVVYVYTEPGSFSAAACF